MKKLDWYILKKLLVTFIFVAFLLELIICVIDYTEKNDDFIKNEVAGELIWKYYLTFIPFIASLLTPIIVFITTVFVTAKLAAKTEIIAILASGVSFLRMLLPYLIASIIIGSISFYLNAYVIPDANKFRIHFELEYLKSPFFNSDKHIHMKISPDGYIYLYRYDNHRNIGSTVTMERIQEEVLIEKITANQIVYDSINSSWTLNNWQKRIITDSIEILESGSSMDTVLNMSPSDFGNKEDLQETMTMSELNDYIDLQSSRGADDVGIYLIEKYNRYMQPFAVIILMFIGAVMSARKSRQGTGFQIALGFVIAFFYIIMFILAKAIAEAGTMNTIMALWIPNITFSLVGLLLYRTVPR